MDKSTVILAGTQYQVAPLSLGQMRDLRIGLIEKQPKELRPSLPQGGGDTSGTPVFDSGEVAAYQRAEWDQRLAVVSTALRRFNPDMTVEKLLESDATIEELAEAFVDVLKIAGLVKDASSGEDRPVQAGQSAGNGSTAT